MPGTQDVVVGAPIAGRVRPEVEQLIGFFVNTLVLRTDCSGDPTFAELLGRVRETALGAYAHQDLPFEQLVEELDPPRDLSRNPVVQVTFQLMNMPRERLDVGGLRAERLASGAETTRFDLTVHLLERDRRLDGRMVFNADLFDAVTVAGLAEAFGRVLAAVAADAGVRVSELPVVDEAAARVLAPPAAAVSEAGGPGPLPGAGLAAAAGGAVTVAGLFAQRVAACPDAVALADGPRRVTYAGLDAAAGRVAGVLRAAGAGPGDVVGVCAAGAGQMVAGLLGVLRAGAAYLPLDPGYPAARLAFMLADSGTSLVLAGPGTVLPPADGVRVIPLGAALEPGAARTGAGTGPYPGADPGPAVAGDLAYVIYTSGSSGRPKGVEVSHGSLGRVPGWLGGMVPGEVALLAPLSFDASWRAVGVLALGGCLHVLDERADPGAVRGYLESRRVAGVSCTPSLLEPLLAGGPWRGPLTVLAGGEAFPARLWRQAAARGGVRAFNLYGPTEVTVDATAAAVEGPDPVIGRPLPGVTAYVVDPDGALVPAGAVGELLLGGPQVARGYRGRAGLTAERFVPDRFGGVPGARLYRTGDLVRARPAGRWCLWAGRMTR